MDGARANPEQTSRELTRFVSSSLRFVFGLVCVLLAVDRLIGSYVARHPSPRRVAADVLEAQQVAAAPGAGVKVIYLGDSVARQLFPPGEHPGRHVRSLTSNQAISLAGQYYLFETALRHCPAVSDVYLFYHPNSFANDMSPPLRNDYFCGCFHSPEHVAEVWRFKHDARLTMAHVGRMLLPHLMLANSGCWASPAYQPPPRPVVSGVAPPPPDPEPVLSLVTKTFRRQQPNVTHPPSRVPLSQTSRVYLLRMRQLCTQRHIRLHVIPCPCSDALPFGDVSDTFDQPILYLPRDQFRDGVHFAKPFLARARRQFIRQYHLEP